MRVLIMAVALAIGLAPSIAKADEDVCFINNSSSDIRIEYFADDNESFAKSSKSLGRNSGDRNVCVAIPADAGNQSPDPELAYTSYVQFGTYANEVEIDRQLENWIIFSDPENGTKASAIFSNGSVHALIMAFLNPMVGSGSFYYAEPHKTSYSTDQMNWPSNTRVCNTVAKVCRYWARGDDKIYRVVYEDYTVPDYEEWEL